MKRLWCKLFHRLRWDYGGKAYVGYYVWNCRVCGERHIIKSYL